jgi:DNA primase
MIIKEYANIQKFLIKNHNNESISYLKKRGFKKSYVKDFGIGFVKDEEIFNTIKIKNAITIPIYDLRNRIVAFYCRSIEHDGRMKYIGSHNFPYIYEKNRMFFNLNKVLYNYYNRKIFIVEGQLDAISLAQMGLKNVVAIMGNKMSDIQQEIIYRYFDKVYLLCDGDEAGKNLVKINEKLKKLTIYKVDLKYKGCKDVNNFLLKNIDIKKFIKKRKELVK